MRRYRKTIMLGALSFLCVTLIGALINIVTGRLPPETPYLAYALPALAVVIAAGVGLYVWQERAAHQVEQTTDSNQAGSTQTNAQGSQGFVNQSAGPISQNFGEQANIATEGGAYVATSGDQYAGRDIIGQQIVQPSLTPALHQLRAPVGDFVGREREIDQLVQALSKAGGATAAISGVRGMGGIGKTELAYTVAQRLAEHFPDAQLLIELRGASGTPLTPEQALQTVIRAFERETKLPDDQGQLKGLYNAVLSGKGVLILADDARDAAHVRPLLPPAGCAVLITSRTHFALPGMAALDLGTLPPDEAVALLLEICPRIGDHAPELARLCGALPKALRISATLLATHTSRDVTAYLNALRDEHTRLAHLRDAHDPELDIEASLLLSYDALSNAAQSALCQLSVFPTSFDRDAAQTVVEVPAGATVDGVLEELCRLSLLEWHAGWGATACTSWYGRSRRPGWTIPRQCGCGTPSTLHGWHHTPGMTSI